MRLAAADDPVGKRFGFMTVIAYSHRGRGGASYYLCQCDCGNQKAVLRGDIGRKVRSCGCKAVALAWEKRWAALGDQLDRYIPEPNTGCWLWDGPADEHGYGVVALRGSNERAHRYFWTMLRGTIPLGQCVLHRCDTPACVNPGHLFLGTMSDNSRDMIAKGRAFWQKKSA